MRTVTALYHFALMSAALYAAGGVVVYVLSLFDGDNGVAGNLATRIAFHVTVFVAFVCLWPLIAVDMIRRPVRRGGKDSLR